MTGGPAGELRKLRESHLQQHREQPCDAGSSFEFCRWCHPELRVELQERLDRVQVDEATVAAVVDAAAEETDQAVPR